MVGRKEAKGEKGKGRFQLHNIYVTTFDSFPFSSSSFFPDKPDRFSRPAQPSREGFQMPGSPIGSGTGPTVSFDKLTTKPTPNIPLMRRARTERRSNDSSYNVISGAEFSGNQYVEPCVRNKNPEKFYEGAGAGRKAFTEKMVGSIKGIDQGSCWLGRASRCSAEGITCMLTCF